MMTASFQVVRNSSLIYFIDLFYFDLLAPPPSFTKDKRKDIYNILREKNIYPQTISVVVGGTRNASVFLCFVQIPHSGIGMSKKGFKNGGIASRELGGSNEEQRSHVSLDV